MFSQATKKRPYSYNVCIRRPSLITALYLIDDLHDSYFKILGKSKKEQDNLIYFFLLDQQGFAHCMSFNVNSMYT